MVAFEIAFLMFLGAVFIVAIAAGGRPLAEAYAEQVKHKYRELGSSAETILSTKVSLLQQEVSDLKERIAYLEQINEAKTGTAAKDARPQHTSKSE